MTEQKPRVGDRVRITYEAEYINEAEALGPNGTVVYPVNSVVEVLEPADDPSKDAEGTVRRDPESGVIVALTDRAYWWAAYGYCGTGSYTHAGVAGWPVIGAVPGTPAAEAEKREKDANIADLREKLRREEAKVNGCAVDETAQREPRVFRADGPEPPEDVEVLEWHGDLENVPGYLKRSVDLRLPWVWVSSPDADVSARIGDARWPIPRLSGEFREVSS